MNNVIADFVTYLESLGIGTLGTDIFIGGVPLDVTGPVWWVIASGGISEPKNNTGERLKNYNIDVLYRNSDASIVYNKMQALEEQLNSKNCTQLAHYETIDMEALSFPSDQDLDENDRTVGMLQARIMVYQN